MIRKFVLAAAAIAALGTVSLIASPASARGMGGGHHHHGGGHFHGGLRIYGGDFLYSDYSCLRRTWVVNRYGETVLRTINVCD